MCVAVWLQLVAFAHDIVDDDEDFDENLPFMAVEPRSKQKQTRRGGQRRRLNHEDALEALYGLRNELEVRADWDCNNISEAAQHNALLAGLHSGQRTRPLLAERWCRRLAAGRCELDAQHGRCCAIAML
jgi:hypothetical protein